MRLAAQPRAIFRHQNFLWSEHLTLLTFWLAHVLRATAACNFSTSELQKVVQAPHCFNILTCKCASRHSSVPFFDIWTSKSGPVPWVCLAFWLAHVLCATAAYNFSTSELQKVVQAPHRFNILTCKCASRHSSVPFFDIWTSKSGPVQRVCLAFWLAHVLRATAAYNFSTSELQKVVQAPHRFNILTCKCASRHSSVPFFDIWTSKSGPVPWVCLAFCLAHVLRATAAYNFSTSELQKVVQAPHRFNILTCKCASRHSSVPFFDIWTSKSGPVPWVCLAFWLARVLRATAAYNFSTSELQKVV